MSVTGGGGDSAVGGGGAFVDNYLYQTPTYNFFWYQMQDFNNNFNLIKPH